LTGSALLLASTARETAFVMNRFSILIILLTASVSVRAMIAQEAVTEKPAQETEEAPAEETTPAESPSEESTDTKSAKGLRKMMTIEEFTAAGLDKLSPSELEYLDSWMKNYRRTAEKKAADKAAAQVTAKVTEETTKKVRASIFNKREPIVSRINGNMGPLTGHTIITLEDGTRWKQANLEDRYRPKVMDHPAAVVLHTTFGYKMRIEGMPDFYVNPASEDKH
jgi:hypothetical protein